MNIVLTRKSDTNKSEFYLAAVKRSGDIFTALSKRITNDGRMIATCSDFKYKTEKEAKKKVRDLIKIKMKKQDWNPIDLSLLPVQVIKFLEVPPEMQVTPEELVMILRDAQKERYFTFSDVAGLEEYFDAGIEYLGYETGDAQTFKAFDRFGTLRECFIRRLSKIEPTERAIEAKTLANRMEAKL
jgi:hypothetical protein